MVKKTLLFKKIFKLKKGALKQGQFFSDQHLLKNQISIDDLEEDISDQAKTQELEEKLGEANQEVAKQGSKKKKIINSLMFVFNIIVVVAILTYQLSTSEVESFSGIITSGLFKPIYILLLAIAFALTIVIDSYRTSSLLRQSTRTKRQFSLCYKMVALGRYWDGITPLSAGGEPFQIYYLSKHNVKADATISVTLARYILFQLGWLLISIFATIYSSKIYGQTNLVSVASFVGFVINASVLIGTWVLSRSKKLGKILVAKALKLLHKMHIVKNYEKQYEKVMTTVTSFQNTMAQYTKNMWWFLGLLLSQVVQFIIQYTMPYLIYLLLGGTPDASIWLMMLMLTVLIDLASSFIPLPGGTGMSEVSFTIVFSSIFPNGTAFWGLIMWRFMTYYIILIQGLIVSIYDYVWGDKKFEWQKKKWELETESNRFKQNQVKKYSKRSKGKIKL